MAAPFPATPRGAGYGAPGRRRPLGKRGVAVVAAAVAVAAVLATTILIVQAGTHSIAAGSDRIVGAQFWIEYNNNYGGNQTGWLGGGVISTCGNCPLLAPSGSMVTLTISLSNSDTANSHNVTAIFTPVFSPLYISGANVSFPLSIPANSSVTVSVAVGPQGELPAGVTNVTLAGFINADWAP